MPKTRDKPPPKSRQELREELYELVCDKPGALQFLISFFSALDLQGIIKELKDDQ